MKIELSIEEKGKDIDYNSKREFKIQTDISEAKFKDLCACIIDIINQEEPTLNTNEHDGTNSPD